MHPILFEFGPISVRYYGLMYVIALLVGVKLVQWESSRLRLGLTKDEISNFCLLTLLAGILGGRVYYVLFNWDFYSRHPLEVPAIWRGGLAIHGGVGAGFLYALWYARHRGLPFLRLADAVAPSLILGQAFGRFGNFMNGDAHGTPTSLPWGIVFPKESIAGQQFPETPLHPTMLYELLLNLLWFALLWQLRKRPHRDGFIFGLYFGLYSAGRLVVESFRADSLMLGPFRAAQMVGVLLIIFATVWVVRRRLWSAP